MFGTRKTILILHPILLYVDELSDMRVQGLVIISFTTLSVYGGNATVADTAELYASVWVISSISFCLVHHGNMHSSFDGSSLCQLNISP